MSGSSTVLITGANRGIGKGLLTKYISRTNTIVIAGVRDPTKVSHDLKGISRGAGSSLITIKIDSTSKSDAASAVSELFYTHGIKKLNIVIASAGIAKYYGPAGEMPIEELQERLTVNTVGTVILFHAVWPLLKAEENGTPKFVVLNSSAASLTDADTIPFEASAYGASKAAMNYIIRKIHLENEWLIAFPINPGWVQTEMGNAGAVSAGLTKAPNTLQESVGGIISIIDDATRKDSSGKFMSFDKQQLRW